MSKRMETKLQMRGEISALRHYTGVGFFLRRLDGDFLRIQRVVKLRLFTLQSPPETFPIGI